MGIFFKQLRLCNKDQSQNLYQIIPGQWECVIIKIFNATKNDNNINYEY